MAKISKTHALRRTSPKGEDFIGVCTQCGQQNMTIAEAMVGECPNQRGVTQGEAILEAIKGD